MGDGLVVMLLCLQKGQELIAPEGDAAETVFAVLEGNGFIMEDGQQHTAAAGDVVHVLPGSSKAVRAGDGTFTVLGTRRLKGKSGPAAE
jgi:quercetin dioxygenase-like cupin family protein